MQQDDEFVEDNLEQFMFSTSKNQITKKEDKQPIIKQSKKKTNKKTQDLNTIQEMNFKYIWNLLKQHQDSQEVTAIDLARVVQSVMKKPIDEQILKEMININNDQVVNGISYQELREIFIECKLKM